jgi:hypothetical protein
MGIVEALSFSLSLQMGILTGGMVIVRSGVMLVYGPPLSSAGPD